jgi:hypothetical protein
MQVGDPQHALRTVAPAFSHSAAGVYAARNGGPAAVHGHQEGVVNA